MSENECPLFPKLGESIQDMIAEAYLRGYNDGKRDRKYATLGSFILGVVVGGFVSLAVELLLG